MIYEISNDLIGYIISQSADKSMKAELTDKVNGFQWSDRIWKIGVSVLIDEKTSTSTSFEIVNGLIESTDNYKNLKLQIVPFFEGLASQGLEILYSVKIPDNGNWFEENLKIKNSGTSAIILKDFKFQWQKTSASGKIKCLAVPFKSHDSKPGLISMDEDNETALLSEGVELISEENGLIIARKPSDNEPVKIGVNRGEDGIVSFGGIAIGVPGDLNGIPFNPGELLDYGCTRYMFFKGKIEDGLVLYRSFMSENGVSIPQNYNPPINYCIFYECGDYYQHKAVLDEFEYAKELGCTMLYLDQGWEDYSGSGIWDETRLGKLESLVDKAHSMDMEIGVLIKMHARAYNWPHEMTRKDRDGNIMYGDLWGPGHQVGICPSSSEWSNIKTERLAQLVKAGVKFFSFDFNDYQAETACCDESHPHSIPMREWEHVRFVARQQAMVKKACPDVLIEAHDWKSAGEYVYPVYMFNSGHHERWGFEYMWKPFEDFKSGHLHNLYYCNMAYEKPLYLHMDLTSDNENAVVFWYIASTVRHFGVGNYRNLDENKKNIYRNAMKVYKEYKEYFSNGIFMGDGHCIHYHSIAGKGTVTMVFNDSPEKKGFSFELNSEKTGTSYLNNNIKSLFGTEGKLIQTDGKTTIELQLEGYDVSVMYIS